MNGPSSPGPWVGPAYCGGGDAQRRPARPAKGENEDPQRHRGVDDFTRVAHRAVDRIGLSNRPNRPGWRRLLGIEG
jgi:hypothetical protein